MIKKKVERKEEERKEKEEKGRERFSIVSAQQKVNVNQIKKGDGSITFFFFLILSFLSFFKKIKCYSFLGCKSILILWKKPEIVVLH